MVSVQACKCLVRSTIKTMQTRGIRVRRQAVTLFLILNKLNKSFSNFVVKFTYIFAY